MPTSRPLATLVALLSIAAAGCAPDVVRGKAFINPRIPAASTPSGSSTPTSVSSDGPSPTPPTPTIPPQEPCAFRPTPVAPAARQVTPPPNGPAPADPPTTTAVLKTNRGDIPLTLTSGITPCTVLNFLSLAQQHFYDNTPCHRLTSGSLSVLQCGDPAGTGEGGPGYSFADEYPIGSGAGASGPTLYTRGTLAMANAGPDTNGSQFFLVYQDSQLPPHYSIFGRTDDTGLATLDTIAKSGIAPSPRGDNDGAPATRVQILSVQFP